MFLRALAGLEKPQSGRIRFGGESWFEAPEAFVPAHGRAVGACLQDPFLFPHLTVAANVAYPLENVRPRLSREDRAGRARAELERWGASALADSRIDRLSGGEQQRVGLARAFIRKPDLLLLDEPFAALDPPAREELLDVFRRELRARPVPAVWVTHDRAEAILLGGTLAVLLGGKVAQLGPAEEVFRRPADPAVAAFVGTGTILHGLVQAREAGVMRIVCGRAIVFATGSLPPGTAVVISIRAEEVELLLPDAGRSERTSARNDLAAVVSSIRPLGLGYTVELDAGVPLSAAVTRPALQELGLEPGRRVRARIKAMAVQVRSESWRRAEGG